MYLRIMYKNFNVYVDKKSRPILHFYFIQNVFSSKVVHNTLEVLQIMSYRFHEKIWYYIGFGGKAHIFFLQTSFNVVHESMNPGVQINTHYHNKISYGIVSTYQHTIQLASITQLCNIISVT